MKLSEHSLKVQAMFDTIAARYDVLNRVLSFGQDVRWRRALLKNVPRLPHQNGVFYDVACGTGDVLRAVEKQQKSYTTLCGFDISKGMLEKARQLSPLALDKPGGPGISFQQANAEDLPAAADSADCLSIAFGLRNVDNRDQACREFHRVLKPGGTLLILEFFPSQRSAFERVFQLYFRYVLPFVGGLFSDKQAYTYLPKSVSSMPSAKDFGAFLESCGFSCISCQSWLSGSTVLFTCVKRAS